MPFSTSPARWMSPLLALLGVAGAVGCDTGTEAEAGLVFEDTEAYLDREVLVAIDDLGDGVAQMEIEKAYGLTAGARLEGLGVTKLLIDGDGPSVKELVQRLEQDHRVAFAEPNYLVRGQATANDTYRGYQWNLDAVGAEGAWDHTTGAGVVVAVLDTGVRSGGPDGLTQLLQGYDFYYNDSDPTDNDGHGTFVAGTIAQRTNNGKGVAGLAPGAAILPVKVLGDQGYGDINAIASGIVWATDQGADVINMSLGSGSYSQTLERACDYAYQQGVVVVAASGNEYASSVGYPAAFDSVIAVGAARYDGSRAGYSNYGAGLDLLAPGGDLSRDDNGDGYADGILQETIESGQWTYTFWEGTSMATPHVAAAAALLKSVGVSDPDEIRSILVSTARDVGASGYDTATGYGVLNADAAVALALSGAAADPGPSTDTGTSTPPTSGADTTAPQISSVSGYTQGSRFTVSWVTNEPADSYLNFDQYGAFGDGSLTTSHSITLRGSNGSTYVFSIESTDAAGNTATSGPYSISL